MSAAAFLAQAADELLALYPENASILGLDNGARAGLKARLTDRSAEGVARIEAGIAERLAALRRFDRTGLDPEDALHLDIGEAAYALVAEGFGFGFGDVTGLNMALSHRSGPYIVTQNAGAYLELPDFLEAQHEVSTSEDADALRSRLAAFAEAIDGETDRLRSDAARGVALPDFLLDKTIRQIEAQCAMPPADWAWLRGFREIGGVLSLAAERIVPSLSRQAAALADLRRDANEDAGVWKLPDGDAYYDWTLRAHTTTALSAQAIHDIGHEQLALLHARMEPLLQEQGLTRGTIGERMAALAADPRHRFSDDAAGRAALLAHIDARLAFIRTRMADAFATLVPCNMAVRRVPEAIEQGAPDGYAMAGSVDGRVPGYFYINLRDTGLWPRYTLPTLAFHEAIPGHIWQGEYTYRLPLFRSLLSFNAYAEGWALYAEQLADELGAYEGDPLGRLGYLHSLAFRACRLVVDTGLHALRWTRQEAIAWLLEHHGSTALHIAGEVDRYITWPGQACSYKIGHSSMQGLRERARKQAGADFDLREYNSWLVGSGNMPLSILDRRFSDAFSNG